MNASYIQLAQQQITLPNPTGRWALGWDLNQTHPPHGMQEWTASEGRHSSWCLGEQAIYWWAGHKTGGAMLPSDPTSGAETKVTHCLGWRHTNYVHFIFFSLGIQFRLLHCPVSLAFRWEPCTWFLSNGMWMVARWPHPSMTKKKKINCTPYSFHQRLWKLYLLWGKYRMQGGRGGFQPACTDMKTAWHNLYYMKLLKCVSRSSRS